ncbi:CHAT domain-containing protein [Neolewinella xylanilytica]|uniref:CHAT domain-containing protein n=1 Tax=Neolewinella xylanilytica TaxID=1514080 RepID=A0A2S6I9I2_9BACT|nr:CHAT domain-containing protein [Neolewinella xylanilytica]PPK88155.1 CHAT domain-containing protein [Neolewinella xylanilytica]
MKSRFLLFTIVVAASLLHCGDHASSSDSSRENHPLSDSLEVLRKEYEAARLPEAMARARRLRLLTERSINVPPSIRTMGYQYLALLHFDRAYHRDSVEYFTRLAEAQMPAEPSGSLRARQLLCQAYQAFLDWSYRDIQIYAQYGRHLLAESSVEDEFLNALLLTIEGRGCKQQADKMSARSDKEIWWDISAELLKEADRTLDRIDSPWRGYPLEHLAILTTRRPEADQTFFKIVETIDRIENGTPFFGSRDRLLAYFHYHRDNYDSTVVYAGRLVSDTTSFNYGYVDEAYYYLMKVLEFRQDFRAATSMAKSNMQSFGCCPPGEEDPLSCHLRLQCTSLLNPMSDYQLKLYKDSGDRIYLNRANLYAQTALNRYDAAIRGINEESVLNRSLVVGERLFSSVLRASVAVAQDEPNQEHLDAAFQAMEGEKSFLLVQELMDRTSNKAGDSSQYTTTALVEVETEIQLLKTEFDTDRGLSEEQLERFWLLNQQRIPLRARILDRRKEVISASGLRDESNTLPYVCERLNASQALLEFSEVDSFLILLYVDRDTQALYTAPLRPVTEHLLAFTDHFNTARGLEVEEYARVANQLLQDIAGPVVQLMRQRKELLVVPSPHLQSLPFSALVIDRGPNPSEFSDLRYAVDEWNIRYLSSWRTERHLAQRRNALRGEAPVVGIWTHSQLDGYLGDVAQESIAATSTDYNHYRKDDCSSKSFLRFAKQYDILHLSAHAKADTQHLHRNFLYMAPGDSLNELRISERSWDARLVVLAACSTDRGQSFSREGNFSLRRSFHLAGVPDVVASFYDIPASATNRILMDFYRYHLGRGCTVSESLARAQRRAAHRSEAQRDADPRQWAGLLAG